MSIETKKKYIIHPRCHPDRKYCARGLCKSCYSKLQQKERPRKIIKCKSCGLSATHRAFGMCATCSRKKWRNENLKRSNENDLKNSRKQRRKADHKEKVSAYRKKYRDNNSELRKRLNEKSREYYKKNRLKLIKINCERKKQKSIEQNREKYLLKKQEMEFLISLHDEMKMTYRQIGDKFKINSVTLRCSIHRWKSNNTKRYGLLLKNASTLN